ncbi:FAD:protein FMN transferase [Clostridium sp. C8-1-8]|uniref:FAD:protein FMN transferase n=1 Tax=Clostridium sp. C8-1-8 TaxID=2698831 RepID=UPI00136E7392|nr:FAD:protein FMN transferase [Clostridium sp. C8-1-8]
MSNYYEIETLCMGTIISQRVYGINSEIAAIKVEEEMKRLEYIMNFFSENSEVSRINKAAGKYAVEVGAEVLYVLNRAKYFSEVCKGTFDVTVGPLAKLWGIFTDKAKIPTKEEIEQAISCVSYKDISIDNGLGEVRLMKSGESIDLGAIAKGYAADRAMDIYRQYSIESAFVNLGGNVMVLGNKPDNSPWRIGIQNPFLERGVCLGAVNAFDKTVVTSGDYVRFFEKDNKKYHHIIDPRTGYPSDSNLVSATIVADQSIGADAVSTGIFILGLDEGINVVKNLKGMEAIFVTKEKEVHITKGLERDFTFFEGMDDFKVITR